MDYKDFNCMLSNVYDSLKESNGKLFLPEVITEKKPTRIDFINVTEIFKIINRDIKHFIKFLDKTRGISSDFHNKKLLIQGKYNKDNINKYLIEYIKKYVFCPSCKNYHTLLVKDGATKKEKIKCLDCNSINFVVLV